VLLISALTRDLNDWWVDFRIGKAIGVRNGQCMQCDIGDNFQHEAVVDPKFPGNVDILV
jgi:hypothetical protein